MIWVRALTPAEVHERLSLSEFLELCNLIDEKNPPSEWIQSGPDVIRTLGRLNYKTFRVLRVERGGEEVAVFLDLGKGKVKWMVVKAQVKKKAMAA